MTFEFLQQNWIWVLMAAISGTALLWPLVSGQAAREVSPIQATLMINREDALLLDVRDDGEWQAGHVPGARHIALVKLSGHLVELEKFKERPLIVCCAAGMRSATGCTQLKKAGFSKVYSLAGGLDAWKAAQLPLTTKT